MTRCRSKARKCHKSSSVTATVSVVVIVDVDPRH